MVQTSLRVFDCRWWSGAVVDGSKHPPSLHICKQLVGCRSPDDVERHVCVNYCKTFDHLPRSRWAAHKDDACGVCGVSCTDRRW
jgi:hypothetical protein